MLISGIQVFPGTTSVPSRFGVTPLDVAGAGERW